MAVNPRRAYSVLVSVLGGPGSSVEQHIHADVRVSIPTAAVVDGDEVLGATSWQAKSLMSREDLELEMARCALALAVKDGARW